MKNSLLSLLLLLLLESTSFGNGEDYKSFLDDAVVEQVEFDIVWPDKFLIEAFWDRYSEKSYTNIGEKITNRFWRKKFWEFSSSLIAKANSKGLNGNGLAKCLSRVLAENGGKYALIPVAALSFDYEGEEAWMIICNWEYTATEGIQADLPDQVVPSPDSRKILSLNHIRMWAIVTKSQEVVAFTTCD